jgi:MFS family permease
MGQATFLSLLVPTLGTVRLTVLCVFFALGSFVWGYTTGILGTIYVAPGFLAALHNPTAPQFGMMTAFYYLGTWTSFVFIAPRLADTLGRRYAAFVGMWVVCVGTAVETGAGGDRERGVAMMITGRVIAGLGTAVLSTSVPLFQA